MTDTEKEKIRMSNQTPLTNGTAPPADVPGVDNAQDLPARNLAEGHQALAAPYPGACVGYLPNRLGANSQWAAVFPYVDVTAIQDRLDLVVGPDRWSHEVTAIDEMTLGCRLRLYEVADCEVGQGSDRWSQSANAFKRCAPLWGRAVPDAAPAGAAQAGRRDHGQLEGPAVCDRSAPRDLAPAVRGAGPGRIRSFRRDPASPWRRDRRQRG